MRPSKSQMKIPMMLESTRRRILVSRSATSRYKRAFSSAIAACEASSFSTAIRADQLGLFQQRQAKKRPYPFAAHVFIFGKHALSAGIIEDHLALSADNLIKDQQGQFRRRHRRFDKTDPDAIATARRSRLDPVSAVARKEQEAAVGPGMLDGNHHQRLDQLLEHDLAGHGLRHLDDRGEIELFDRRLDGWLLDQGYLLSDSGVALVELRDLCLGAPAGVAVAGLVQIDIGHLVETAKVIESSCQFDRE